MKIRDFPIKLVFGQADLMDILQLTLEIVICP